MNTTPKPYDDRDGLIWYNGRMVEWRSAQTHVLTHGLHYASSVFEGVRAYNGKIFKNTEHNQRFHQSANLLGFKIPYSVAELDAACEAVIKANNLTNAYLRPLAWRGSEQMAVLADKSKVHVAIATWEWPSYFSLEARKKGLKLCWADWKRPSPETAPVASKAAGLYMICTLSKNDAVARGFEDAVMLDWRGYVAECTGANVFFLIDGAIHTPLPDCFLDGITRRTVIELIKKRGLEVVERRILPEDLAKATDAFLTGTAAEVTPIASISGMHGNFTFTPGNVTFSLMQDYTDLVNKG